MSVNEDILQRSQNKCELCHSQNELEVVCVEQSPLLNEQDFHVALCNVCRKEIIEINDLTENHWFCLNESMWSTIPAVQILAWRQLHYLAKTFAWAQDLLDQMYLDDEHLQWAQAGLLQFADENQSNTKDSNGNTLVNGDSVTLIKDLEVKGAGFTAKRGTLVKNINLTDDPGLIEGKVNGTQIVLKTCFLKKA